MGIKARIVASLLWRNGRLVKGVQMKDHRDAGNPATTIKALCAQGIDEIICLNISGEPAWQALEEISEVCTVPLTWGAIHSPEDARRAFLAGADKIFVSEGHFDLCEQLAGHLGNQAIVAGIDWRGHKIVVPRCGEIRLLCCDREGRGVGLGTSELREYVQEGLPVIIEGGARTLAHIAEGFRNDASAVALGTMLVFGDNNIVKIKRYLKAQGIPVRL